TSGQAPALRATVSAGESAAGQRFLLAERGRHALLGAKLRRVAGGFKYLSTHFLATGELSKVLACAPVTQVTGIAKQRRAFAVADAVDGLRHISRTTVASAVCCSLLG